MTAEPTLARRIGAFDATMLVMGGIVGAGIFVNPSVVAQIVSRPALILGAWLMGGLIAMFGAFIFAEIAARQPQVGGQYAYLRDAFHPLVAFLLGWTSLLVVQSGGMAAVAITFARYFQQVVPTGLPDTAVAVLAVVTLVAVNCLGVGAGNRVQSVLMVTKIGAIAVLVVCGFLFVDARPLQFVPVVDTPLSFDLLTVLGATMVPVLFSYGGWQTSSFASAELTHPTRDLPRALLWGVTGVVILYVAVSYVCLRALGPEGLARTTTPATDVMSLALGEPGRRFIALGIAVSTLGFLSQGILTAPRLYYAMARDGLFFRKVGELHPSRRVPVTAILCQGLLTTVVALSGRYDQILNYVVSVDWIFFGLTAATLFVFRRRGDAQGDVVSSRAPGHPWTTAAFVLVSWLVVANTVYRYPSNALIGVAILVAGLPAYWLWRRDGVSRPSPAS